MRNASIYLLIVLLALSCIAIPTNALSDTGIVTDSQTAAITMTDSGFHVEETIILTNHGSENVTLLRFWIQSDVSSDVSIVATKSGTALQPVVNGNIRECNLSATHLVLTPLASMEVTVSYTLPTSTARFTKDFLYNTSQLIVTYNTQPLLSGKDFVKSTPPYEISIQLYNPSEAPLGLSTLLIVFLIVVIVLTLLLLVFRRQRRRKRVGTVDTPQTLVTKKDLLLELLKDLEKRYRAKDISDETYTKLKEEYKAQAVDTMRRLEDVKKPES